MTHRPARALLAIVALVATAAAWSAEPAAVDPAPAWAKLSKPQKTVLAPLERDWASIDSGRKQKWLELARRFPTLPEPERLRIQERMMEWARMSPTDRGRARLQFQESRQVSPEDRQARWEAYKALPDEQRLELARRAKPAAKLPAAETRTADNSAKRNTVPSTQRAPLKQVAPTLVQAKPGATTTLITTKPAPPAHQQPGLPKIAASHGFVDPNTLLPRRGPQGAPVQLPVSSVAEHP